MSQQRLPLIGASGDKTIKATSKPSGQRPPRSKPRKRAPPPSSVLVSDSCVAPWGGLHLSESSFTSMSPPRPPSVAPPPPPAPHTTPASPRAKNQSRSHSSSSETSTSSPSPLQDAHDTGGAGRTIRLKRRPLPPHRAPRPPRLPPLRQVSNLSFSRSFTFSFFELPLYQSPRCRAERTKNLLLLLKQVHF